MRVIRQRLCPILSYGFQGKPLTKADAQKIVADLPPEQE